MLFVAAALLYSSAHLLGVAGSVVVPGHGAEAPSAAASSSISLASETRHIAAPVLLQAPVQGDPGASSTLASCGADRGRATPATARGHVVAGDCLAELGRVGSGRLSRFAASFDDDDASELAFATALGERGSAGSTHSWWTGLAQARRDELISTLPAVVGNLEGVPYEARDIANRITLHSTIARLEQRASTSRGGFVGADGDARRLTMLEQVDVALDNGREGDDSPRSLLSLDTVFPGKAAVAVGDVDTADNVTLMVPGMLYTVSNQIAWWTDRAADLHSEQDFWSSTLATDATKRRATNATVAWMGYRTPGLTNVLGLSLAKAGAVHLEDAVQGVKAARAGAEPRVTLIAHSYGSTTATLALASGAIHVDSFVALGSPGSVAARAGGLAVTRGNVYAAAAAFDPVAGSGVFGADPGSTAFGATLLDIGGGIDPYTEQRLTPVFTHNRYFTPGSRSMRNLALIGIGRGSLANGRRPTPGDPLLANQPSLAFVRPQDVSREPLSV